MQPGREPVQRWRAQCGDGGALVRTGEGLRLINLPASAGCYSNAQVDDHAHLPRHNFAWRPPARLSLRARFSHGVNALTGTAGFGFWNDPFAMNGRRAPALPHVAWFFLAAPPSNIAPALGVPGSGWKAAVMDADALPLLALLPTAPLAIPLMRNRLAYHMLWPVAQHVLGADEDVVDADMVAWHSYTIEWHARAVHFFVDDRCVLKSRRAPRGPLGVVIWMDNQFLVATPQGRIGHGVAAQRESQWMDIADVIVE